MKSLRRFLHLFLTSFPLCFFASSVSAQSAEQALIRCDFRTYSLGERVTDLYYFSEGTYLSVEAPNNKRSIIYSYSGDRMLNFYRKAVDSEGNEIFNVVCSTPLNSGMKKAFVIFLPSTETDGSVSLRAYSVPDSFRTSESGKWMVLNLTDRELTTRIEADIQPFRIVPGQSELVQPEPRENDSYIFSVAERIDGQWRPIYNSTWGHREGKRAIIFLLPRGSGDRGITVRRFFEPILTQSAN